MEKIRGQVPGVQSSLKVGGKKRVHLNSFGLFFRSKTGRMEGSRALVIASKKEKGDWERRASSRALESLISPLDPCLSY